MLFRTLNDKHINEECGVFGIWSRTPFALAPVVYYGLYALQQDLFHGQVIVRVETGPRIDAEPFDHFL